MPRAVAPRFTQEPLKPALEKLLGVPVWIENLGRVMPKGALIPVPLLCSLTFGQALSLIPNESRDDFLKRSREALLALAPPAD